MPMFVALLRGVNVGTARRVQMAELRALLSRLGYTGVGTLLNSGNAVFRAGGGTPAEHAADISAALVSELKVAAPVVVKSAGELAAIISECPIKSAPSGYSQFLVAFVQEPTALVTLAPIEPLVVPPERFVIGSQAAYLWCATGIRESKAAAALLGKAGKSATTRNWSTVLKLRALASDL
ncbi:MAG: DUF1697 domain-containing protein [Candidatus Schekmanbacteria bacterium]|nr:DUF1697 domain-containing protein [Candidatus Schekmanbacteria bacterium]